MEKITGTSYYVRQLKVFAITCEDIVTIDHNDQLRVYPTKKDAKRVLDNLKKAESIGI